MYEIKNERERKMYDTKEEKHRDICTKVNKNSGLIKYEFLLSSW